MKRILIIEIMNHKEIKQQKTFLRNVKNLNELTEKTLEVLWRDKLKI